ncbi:P-loop containing nucleoside triphosphate hydrolase protein [Chiua virens]|nr:P-loop containing nucleoside triphosphate hydrolase protein [Chiua virens]
MFRLSTRKLCRLRSFSTTFTSYHENPLGLPPGSNPAPQVPRRGGPIQKKHIPHVSKVLAVASGKGGVGKSTVAVNLAFALAMRKPPSLGRRLRVGILDLDIFGPSIPTLMGLQNADEPALTAGGALMPIINHGLPTMSMGYLLPKSTENKSREDAAIVWRGLMVQKAVQQLLFDVDWRESGDGPGLDVLVIDMPPGTGDVPLTLGQLVVVNGAVIISTPQDVALADVRRGISMFRKVSVPITGTVLNQAYFVCPSCMAPHELFGSSDAFCLISSSLGVPTLGELPLVKGVSISGDKGIPYLLTASSLQLKADASGGVVWRGVMEEIASKVWESIA